MPSIDLQRSVSCAIIENFLNDDDEVIDVQGFFIGKFILNLFKFVDFLRSQKSSVVLS